MRSGLVDIFDAVNEQQRNPNIEIAIETTILANSQPRFHSRSSVSFVPVVSMSIWFDYSRSFCSGRRRACSHPPIKPYEFRMSFRGEKNA